MAMGILGQLVANTGVGRENVYIVPAGKVAVFNIFVTNIVTELRGYVFINNTRISTINRANEDSTIKNAEIKSIIGNAGTIVQFQGCTGIVTGYEEDA